VIVIVIMIIPVIIQKIAIQEKIKKKPKLIPEEIITNIKRNKIHICINIKKLMIMPNINIVAIKRKKIKDKNQR